MKLHPSPDTSERERKEGSIEPEQQEFHCERSSMAEADCPVSEPLGGAVSVESTVSVQSLFDTSKRSTQAITPSRLAGGPDYPCHEEPKETVSEICKELSASPPTRETNCSGPRASGEPGEQEHFAPPRALSRPHSLAETHTPSHHHDIVVNAVNDNPRASRTVQSIKPAPLPVNRSHLDTLPLVKQGLSPLAPDSENCGLAYHRGDKSIQEAESHSMLACKQPMQLQQCNIITTVCRGANSGDSGVQQPQSRCVCISSPNTAAKVKGVGEKADLPLKCDMALCYCSYIHHANFEDTFAAYCHPQPIPAPSQLLPRLAGVKPSCDLQREVEPSSVTNRLTLPRLMSSVSDTGLDTKHLLRCCNLNYSWISPLPLGAGPQSQKFFGGEECCGTLLGHVKTTTRDMGTMTTHTELRDVGVQTGQTVKPHVFPHICLTENSRSETSCRQSPKTDSNGGRKQSGAPKSPVKEVKWDAEGMTWEVYGASVDPEELGLAIQKHLELQIKETASHAAKLSQKNTNASQPSGNTGCRSKRSKMMGSIRTPACCARTTSAVD